MTACGLPPVVPCCYPEECWAHGSEELYPDVAWAGPCWGKSEVIDEDYTDEDHWWIHACEGHPDRFGKYVPPPSPQSSDEGEGSP